MLRLVALVVVLVGCKERNDQFCLNQDNQNEPSCMVDGPPVVPCSSNAECTAPTAVCDTVDTMSCVQCTAAEAEACMMETPICGADHSCRRCLEHTDCVASNACLPSGACAMEADVAYVQAGATGTCDKASPCGSMTVAIATGRDIVKVNAGTVNDLTTTTITREVTILADPAASINVVADDVPVLSVATGGDVKIFDLVITGGTQANGVGISVPAGGNPKLSLTRVTITNNQGGGISVAAGVFSLTQSTINANQGGGIVVTGAATTFDITNNFIFRNGDSGASVFGGVNIGVTVAGTNRLAFNTIVDNEALGGATRSGGVICDITGFTGANNIIARNTVGGSTTVANAQTLGNCMYPSSKVQSDLALLNLKQPDDSPFDYSLTAGSSAIDAAITPVTVDVDYEDDPRPGSSPQKDIGADEL
jgi:hypothetical protein